ncbi:LemA family protein [Candidatus Pacearchaeota archaeon]|nr:LemA family protein [Candidatus Pacearchaeota archaeon]
MLRGKIAYARQHYNDVVMALNNKVQAFPSNFLASMFGFRQEELFKAAESEIFPLLEKAKNYTLIGKPLYYLLDIYAIGKRYFSTGRNGNAYIRFGCPVDINNLGKNRKEIADEIMEQIKALKESDKKLN